MCGVVCGICVSMVGIWIGFIVWHARNVWIVCMRLYVLMYAYAYMCVVCEYRIRYTSVRV